MTVDLQVMGQRHRDIKNGLTVPPQIKLSNIIDMATKAALDSASIHERQEPTFGNLHGHVKGMEDLSIRSHNGPPISSIRR